MSGPPDPLEHFSSPVRAWFNSSFPRPTAAQAEAWGPISRGEHTLLSAPTGSGKTLAAFLWALDSLGRQPVVTTTKVLYISPLRALAVDVDKNLKAPLKGIQLAAQRLGESYSPPTIGVRTGDTAANERRKLIKHPPEILITTPESLYLMLTSAARETLLAVETVIIDEIHALASGKRGAHMSLSLERLVALQTAAGDGSGFQRIGLSATQRPLEVVADFLGGSETSGDEMKPRPVTIIDSPQSKELDLKVVVPVEDMADLSRNQTPADGNAGSSIWPSIHPELLDLVEKHNSTLVFVNARRLSERLASRLNDLAHHSGDFDAGEGMGSSTAPDVEELVKAHHGSLSRERRLQIEDELKRGDLRGLVATSSLELGIDMGAVDLVVQVSSPGSVAAGLQRIGRAGHQVGVPSKGRIFPKHRSDLLEAATVTRRMREGLIERTAIPGNPLDVLAQQLVAMVALPPLRSPGNPGEDEYNVDELYELVRRSDNFTGLSRTVFDSVLDLLAGRYPSEEFSDLRQRVVWDRVSGTVRGRSGAQRLAVTNAGTIADRGLFGVFLPDGTRVGELDEEMVYESRVGENFLLGASTWKITEITFERVVVVPAPGQPGKMPFWHGDGPGRDAELGRAVGELVRALRSAPAEQALELLCSEHDLDELAAGNLMAFMDEQAEATGVVPDDRTIVVERFRDEIGDWRICIHTPFGSRVHAPWGIVLRSRLSDHFEGGASGVEVIWSDDGIVIRLPESAENLPRDMLFPDPEEVEAELVTTLPTTSAFASRFRECSARALLLPRRRPDQRTPLWQQRQRAADLLSVASKYPSFPMLLEATREMCNDVFDLPALKQVLSEVRSRKIRSVEVQTQSASPFARSLLFGWVAVYMYEGDAPLAERRAAALSLDRELLRELLGNEELRSLLDADVLATAELELQRLVESRSARDADELLDILRAVGPLSAPETLARVDRDSVGAAESWIQDLIGKRRVIEIGVAGEPRLAAAEDAGRLRDALGAQIPMGLPAAFTEPVGHPIQDLLFRYARTHGPFTTDQASRRYGLPRDLVAEMLRAMESDGVVCEGEFTPNGTSIEWCETDVLRMLRRRSLAALRKEVEPVESVALARFLPGWQGIGGRHRGPDAVAEALGVLQGAAVPASTLEPDVLSLRVRDYGAGDLDQLCATGEVVWLGAGSIGSTDGRVRLMFSDQVATLLDPPASDDFNDSHHRVLLDHLESSGASFWPDIQAAVAAAGLPTESEVILAALWDLVWAGLVSNDTIAPLRALVTAGFKRRSSGARSRRPDLRRLSRSGPPTAVGRWSLTASLFARPPSPTEATMARAMQLLERYGILTREMALAEGIEGGFAGVYPMLKLLEERGQVRRGYFVEGLGAAQFALAGAVDRLRSFGADPMVGVREVDGVAIERMPWERAAETTAELKFAVLAATDPAQPWGAALDWPESRGHPSRSAGAYVIAVGGRACAYLERGGRSVLTFPAAADHPGWVPALADLVTSARVRRLRVEKIDGESARSSTWAANLLSVGFSDGYKGLALDS